MNDEEARLLAGCAQFLGSLPADAAHLATALRDESSDVERRRPLAAALNYLFKSIDLIDDGIEGLGFLDDAFVLRVAAEQAGAGLSEELDQLIGSVELVHELLGAELSSRLGKYVHGLRELSVRGRSVDAILSDAAVREELLADVAGWAARYEKPAFARDPKDLVTLRAFLGAKLPA